jgi:hypothetical protein
MGKDSSCEFLCQKDYTQADIDLFKERIDNEYTVNWVRPMTAVFDKIVTVCVADFGRPTCCREDVRGGQA